MRSKACSYARHLHIVFQYRCCYIFYVRIGNVEEVHVDLVIFLQTTQEKCVFFRKQLHKERAMAFLTLSGRALHSY